MDNVIENPEKEHELFVAALITRGHSEEIRSIISTEDEVITLDGNGVIKGWGKDLKHLEFVLFPNNIGSAFLGEKGALLLGTGTSSLSTFTIASATSTEERSVNTNEGSVIGLKKNRNYLVGLTENGFFVKSLLTEDWLIPFQRVEQPTVLELWADYCIIGREDGTIELWDLKAKEKKVNLLGHTEKITGVKIIDYKIVTSSLDETIKIWDLISFTEIGEVMGIGQVTALEGFGQCIIGGSEEGWIRVWNINTMEVVATLWGHLAPITALSVNKDSIISGDSQGELRAWSLEDYREIQVRPATQRIRLATANRQYLAGCIGTQVNLWQYFQENILGTLTYDNLVLDLGMYEDLLLVRDQKRLYSYSLPELKPVKPSRRIKYKNAPEYYSKYPQIILRGSDILTVFSFEQEQAYLEQMRNEQQHEELQEIIDQLTKFLDPIPQGVPYVKKADIGFVVFTQQGLVKYFK